MARERRKNRQQRRRDRREERETRARQELAEIALEVYEPGDTEDQLRRKVQLAIEADFAEERPFLAFLLSLLERFLPALIELIIGGGIAGGADAQHDPLAGNDPLAGEHFATGTPKMPKGFVESVVNWGTFTGAVPLEGGRQLQVVNGRITGVV